jgi:hypothetical protein
MDENDGVPGLGTRTSVAVGINDAGVIIGVFGDNSQPFYRDAQGNFIYLPPCIAKIGGASYRTGIAAVNAADGLDLG